MLDLNFVRDNLDGVRTAMKNRNFPTDLLDDFAVMDTHRRKIIAESHLTKSEGGTLQYIKKKTQDPSALPKAGLVPWVRIAVLVAGVHSPLKFKAPGAIADVPETGALQAASFAWAEVREDWREFVEAFPVALNDRMIFRHPFVGLLGPAQTMIFLNQHLGNHVRQITSIRKTLGV